MAPALAKTPPTGPEWIHEVKFDGWRVQVHVDEGEPAIYSKSGADYTRRFRSLRPILESIRVKNAISIANWSPAMKRGCRISGG
jgi:bifunctional non-homologous end joining protein LigD